MAGEGQGERGGFWGVVWTGVVEWGKGGEVYSGVWGRGWQGKGKERGVGIGDGRVLVEGGSSWGVGEGGGG